MGKGSTVTVSAAKVHEIVKFGVRFEQKRFEDAKAARIDARKKEILAKKPWFRKPATEEQALARATDEYVSPKGEWFWGWEESWSLNGRIARLDIITNLVSLAGLGGVVTLGAGDASWIQFYESEMGKADAAA